MWFFNTRPILEDWSTDALFSENPVVARGTQSIAIIYRITALVPDLIKKSHLERNDGENGFLDAFLFRLF
jgi:hypothetical protein